MADRLSEGVSRHWSCMPPMADCPEQSDVAWDDQRVRRHWYTTECGSLLELWACCTDMDCRCRPWTPRGSPPLRTERRILDTRPALRSSEDGLWPFSSASASAKDQWFRPSGAPPDWGLIGAPVERHRVQLRRCDKRLSSHAGQPLKRDRSTSRAVLRRGARSSGEGPLPRRTVRRRGRACDAQKPGPQFTPATQDR